MSEAPRLGQKEIALFFFPLLLNVQLMSVSHSVINAFLARQHDFVTALAGFSVAMVLHLFFASPSYQNHTVTIAMVRGRRSLRGTVRLRHPGRQLRLGDAGPGRLHPGGRLRPEALSGGQRRHRRSCPLGPRPARRPPLHHRLSRPFPGAGDQGPPHRPGLPRHRRPHRRPVQFLALGARWFSGARLGAFALLACVATETAGYRRLFAWRCASPAAASDEKGPGKFCASPSRWPTPPACSRPFRC